MASFEADLGKLPLEANSAEVYIRTVRRTLDTTDIIKRAKEDVPDVVVEGGVPAVHVMSLFLLGLVEFLCGNALSILAPFYTTEAASKGLSGFITFFLLPPANLFFNLFPRILGKNLIGSDLKGLKTSH